MNGSKRSAGKKRDVETWPDKDADTDICIESVDMDHLSTFYIKAQSIV